MQQNVRSEDTVLKDPQAEPQCAQGTSVSVEIFSSSSLTVIGSAARISNVYHSRHLLSTDQGRMFTKGVRFSLNLYWGDVAGAPPHGSWNSPDKTQRRVVRNRCRVSSPAYYKSRHIFEKVIRKSIQSLEIVRRASAGAVNLIVERWPCVPSNLTAGPIELLRLEAANGNYTTSAIGKHPLLGRV